MKILFYGGCHAAALARIFKRYNSNATQIDHLTNFVLIRNQTPVPYDYIKKFDCVIFSPILNKKQWNTSFLEEFCSKEKILYLKFPWLQWNGYFPGVSKSTLSWYPGGWIHSSLCESASGFNNFEDFRQSVFHGDSLRDITLSNLEATTLELKKRESLGNVDIHISDFIINNFRDSRLFLIPDHATTVLYKFIIPQITEKVGIKIDESFFYTNTEIQSGVQIPILPAVARILELKFKVGDFEHHDYFKNTVFSLTEYLKMCYYSQSIIQIESKQRTLLKISPIADTLLRDNDFLAVASKKKFLARQLSSEGDNDHTHIEILGSENINLNLSSAYIAKADWHVL